MRPVLPFKTRLLSLLFIVADYINQKILNIPVQAILNLLVKRRAFLRLFAFDNLLSPHF
jgi:hypothetical protein